MWQDGTKTLRDLVIEAKEMGFLIVKEEQLGLYVHMRNEAFPEEIRL